MKEIIKTVYDRYRIAIWLLTAAVILYTVFGFLIAPGIVRRQLQIRLTNLFQHQVSVAAVRINPYTLSVTIKDLAIADRQGPPLVTVGRLHANGQPIMSLLRWAVVIKTIEIDGPAIHLVRDRDQQLNISALIPPQKHDQNQTPPAENSNGTPTAPPRCILDRFSLTGGTMAFEDRALGEPFATQWQGIQLLLEKLDTGNGAAPARISLALAGDGQERLNVNGQATVTPLTARADVLLAGVTVAKYAPYYQPFFKGKVTDGNLNLNLTLHWNENSGLIDPVEVECLNLQVEQTPKLPLLRIGALEMAGTTVDLMQHSVRVGTVTTRDGKVWLSRDDQGELNWLSLINAPGGKAGEPAPAAPEEQNPWQVILNRFEMADFAVSVTDRQPRQPAQMEINQIALTAEDLSTRKAHQGKLSLNFLWLDQGRFSAQGAIGLMPLTTDLTIEASDLDLRPAQPYISEHLQLTLTSGKLATRGTLKVFSPEDQAPDIRYSGQVALNDFKSVDSVKTNDFVAWKSLFLSGLELGTMPFRLTIDQVALTDFFDRLVIQADGTTNIGAIFKKTPNAGQEVQTAVVASDSITAPQNTAPETLGAIRINTVTLQGGQVDFRDQLVKPNVHVTLRDVGGRISGLTSIKEEKADVLLRGSTPSKIPFEINGQVNPLIEKPFVDLKIVFTGIDLSPYTPYSAKYLGYELDKGQLSLQLAYLLENNALKGQNKVEIKQFTFGDSVQSPNATKLPVKLAVALLKDRQGNINLDLPVEGSLDDPQFSLGGIILKVLGNLLREIVSSPFKLLGNLFGGGEALQYLAFEPGRTDITPAGLEKLSTLAKALTERPGLNLDIQGQVDPETDTNALRHDLFEKQLKAAKLKSMRRALPPEQIVVSAEERQQLVKQAYKIATFPKPRDEKGNLKKLEPTEMEKLLITAIEIDNDALRELAFERAINTKNHLVEPGGIAAGRLFVVEPEVAAVAQSNQRNPQVQFKVK